MTSNDEHPHPQPETLNHDDGPPDGYEADYFKWRSRMNRRRRFRQQASAPHEQEDPRREDSAGAPDGQP